MTLCAYIKPGGERCRAFAQVGFSTCYGHRPDLAKERRRNASKGGKSGGRGRPRDETAKLKREIRSVIGGVLSGQIAQGQGAVMLQGFNTLLRVHEMERREEVGHHNISPEELHRQMQTVLDLLGRHVPEPERLKAFSEDLAALLDEASG
ncbi:MAG: hypothetical protein M3R38_25945 [Actinomycetota bacterium]|nr:hypothetical protein [Actinomycetota bacterium]